MLAGQLAIIATTQSNLFMDSYLHIIEYLSLLVMRLALSVPAYSRTRVFHLHNWIDLDFFAMVFAVFPCGYVLEAVGP